jgi:hypothetical protein
MSSDINCQNLGNQVDRDHNSANITGILPGSSGGFDHDNGSHNGHNDQVSSPSGNPIQSQMLSQLVPVMLLTGLLLLTQELSRGGIGL